MYNYCRVIDHSEIIYDFDFGDQFWNTIDQILTSNNVNFLAGIQVIKATLSALI